MRGCDQHMQQRVRGWPEVASSTRQHRKQACTSGSAAAAANACVHSVKQHAARPVASAPMRADAGDVRESCGWLGGAWPLERKCGSCCKVAHLSLTQSIPKGFTRSGSWAYEVMEGKQTTLQCGSQCVCCSFSEQTRAMSQQRALVTSGPIAHTGDDWAQ
jgi:hypothetical protein